MLIYNQLAEIIQTILVLNCNFNIYKVLGFDRKPASSYEGEANGIGISNFICMGERWQLPVNKDVTVL